MSPWDLMVYMFAFAGGLLVVGFAVALIVGATASMLRSQKRDEEKAHGARIL